MVILKWKTPESEIKNLASTCTSKLVTTEERIGELEDRSIEIICLCKSSGWGITTSRTNHLSSFSDIIGSI